MYFIIVIHKCSIKLFFYTIFNVMYSSTATIKISMPSFKIQSCYKAIYSCSKKYYNKMIIIITIIYKYYFKQQGTYIYIRIYNF